MTQPRILSMGCGIQTTACNILYHDKYDAVVFADTNNESKETYQYIEKYIKPFCIEKGLQFVTVNRIWQGKPQSVLDEAIEHKAIERYFTQRQCTTRHKIRPILKWIRENIDCNKDKPCLVDIGFSIDESQRIGKDYEQKYVTKNYPLAYERITRRQCAEIIAKHEWPQPPKSACTFCPFMGIKKMREFSKSDPETFQKLVDAENRDKAGRPIFRNKALKNIQQNDTLDNYEMCESGHCFV